MGAQNLIEAIDEWIVTIRNLVEYHQKEMKTHNIDLQTLISFRKMIEKDASFFEALLILKEE